MQTRGANWGRLVQVRQFSGAKMPKHCYGDSPRPIFFFFGDPLVFHISTRPLNALTFFKHGVPSCT